MKKNRNRLLAGLSGLDLESLYPKDFAWTQEQVSYLTDRKNLIKWGTESLIKRQTDFNKTFKNEPISVYRLRQLYREVGIKQRVARVDIALTPS